MLMTSLGCSSTTNYSKRKVRRKIFTNFFYVRIAEKLSRSEFRISKSRSRFPRFDDMGTMAVSYLMSKLDVNITSNVRSLTCVHDVLYTVRHLFTG